ncbi:hypothetical protein PIROE2DRAFT_7771 [Piromyces sp. E2]|nr:hypothetical protein PIROE2DRAFT_7771 [Piromyces sp. E2]|eukprot:OUM65231.1 hypothetical protein PIROE2DRAFT_7771 [Piromyces sp. E2]
MTDQNYHYIMHISPDEHFNSNRYLYNTSLHFIKQTLFHDNNNRNIDKFSSIEKLRNTNDNGYDDINSRLIFSKSILKELQQQQEKSKSLTNSFSFNDYNLNFDQELITNMNDDNPFNDLVLPEDLTNFNTTDKKKNSFQANNEFLFNINQEPEIFRTDKNNENTSMDRNDIPVLYDNSLDERQFGQSNRSNFPWNITSFTTPDRNNTRNILRNNNSSSTSTRSSIISLGSTNLETPTKKRRISFGKNIEFSPLSDDSSYSRHNRSIFDNSNEDIVPFPMATKVSKLLVGKEDSLKFYNYIQDIVEISNNSFFPDEIQRDDETNPSIFFSDLVPSKTSIKNNKEKYDHTFDDDDDSNTLSSTLHPSGRDMAVEAFYHGKCYIHIFIS